MSRLYVGNLIDSVRREDLEDEFSKYGTLKNVWVAQNPPGFAFVEYEDEANANDAVSNMNDAEYFGSRIKVEVSAPRRGGRGGRGGGRGFGYVQISYLLDCCHYSNVIKVKLCFLKVKPMYVLALISNSCSLMNSFGFKTE
jgi:RNA recognition motif-containing protein